MSATQGRPSTCLGNKRALETEDTNSSSRAPQSKAFRMQIDPITQQWIDEKLVARLKWGGIPEEECNELAGRAAQAQNDANRVARATVTHKKRPKVEKEALEFIWDKKAVLTYVRDKMRRLSRTANLPAELARISKQAKDRETAEAAAVMQLDSNTDAASTDQRPSTVSLIGGSTQQQLVTDNLHAASNSATTRTCQKHGHCTTSALQPGPGTHSTTEIPDKIKQFVSTLSPGSKAKLLALTREAMPLPDALNELDWTAPDPPATPAAGTPALMLPAAAAQGDSSPSAHKQAHAAGEDERMDRTGATLKVGDKVKLIAGIDSKLVALEAEVADLNLKGTAVWAPSRMQIDADYLLLKNIKLEDKHKPGASSITFWHSYQQRGIVQGATTLWDKRAQFQKKRPQFWLPVPSKCLVKI